VNSHPDSLKDLKIWFFPFFKSDFGIGENEVEEPNVIPVIAPQLRVDPSRVEDLQLCYAVKISDGQFRD